MKANLKNNLLNPITAAGIFLFIITSIFTTKEPFYLMLTAAQLIFVPLMLQLIIQINRKHVVFTWVAMTAVFLLHILSSTAAMQIGLALIYLIFTFFIAFYGVLRFFKRGFTNWPEISIDVGMVYLFIGGLWFFAFIAGIDTGFSPLITWLTAIHFHYSAFLLPISLGFFGRLHQSKMYNISIPIILSGPMLVAIGITFWPLLEVISVLLYIFAIYTLIVLSFQTRFASRAQAVCVRLSYSALGVSILFSLLYAANRAFGKWGVSIDFMLTFHGFLNCVLFGFAGVMGWVLAPPESKHAAWSFPVSRIRGKLKGEGEPVPGLVADLSDYVKIKGLSPSIVHFYEHTNQYQLVASVKWAAWFKPFALCYKLLSNRMQQLNLPFSPKSVEMTGEILAVNPLLDGRQNPRVWIRKTGKNYVFKAIYSQHETAGRTYMNIALPLPFSTMIGILQLDESDGTLILSSEGTGDPGVYLAAGKYLFKLPLTEYFTIKAARDESLTALHNMRIFGVTFLRIDYKIDRK